MALYDISVEEVRGKKIEFKTELGYSRCPSDGVKSLFLRLTDRGLIVKVGEVEISDIMLKTGKTSKEFPPRKSPPSKGLCYCKDFAVACKTSKGHETNEIEVSGLYRTGYLFI